MLYTEAPRLVVHNDQVACAILMTDAAESTNRALNRATYHCLLHILYDTRPLASV